MKHSGIVKTLALGLTGAALIGFQASAKTVWDMSIAWPAGNFHVANAEEFAGKVKAATGGCALELAGADDPRMPHRVLVRKRTLANVGDDLGIVMRVMRDVCAR